MNKLLALNFITLLATASVSASVEPGTKAPLTNDVYFNYQWYLSNTDQKASHDLDDIHSVEITSNALTQLNWSPGLGAGFRDVVVAVIDSGLDIEHEEFAGQIALNPAECKDGRMPVGPTGDPDKNGFEGDCMGWDFTARDKKLARYVTDDIGHGTHISGLIAARSGNGIGISGVANNIKILPLRVFNTNEERTSRGKTVSITDRVTAALDYAIKRNVDVINLSMGWPRVSHNQRIDQALNRALDAGIVIVAGAGNDRHDQQIYPCAHKRVICVGSVDLDGGISRFSNYGGHVDVYAPGGDILSTWPRSEVSIVFGDRGYEIKSGTSQASPLVAGLAALLKAQDSKRTSEDVRRILIESSVKLTSASSDARLIQFDKALAFGSLQTEKAVTLDLKGQELIALSEVGQFKFLITTPDLNRISSLSLSVLKRSEEWSDLKIEKANNGIEVSGRAKSSITDKVLELELLVNNQRIQHSWQVVRSMSASSNASVWSLNAVQDIRTVFDYELGTQGDVFYSTETKKDAGFILKSYRIVNSEIKKLGERELAPEARVVEEISPILVDLDFDGVKDLFIATGIEKDGKTVGMRFRCLDQQLQDIAGLGELDLIYEDVIPTFKSVRFFNLIFEGTRYRVPAIVAEGPLTSSDEDPDKILGEQNRLDLRLYYYEPSRDENGKLVFKARTYFTQKVITKIRKSLGLSVFEDFVLVNALAPTPEDIAMDRARVLMAVGDGINKTYYQLVVNSQQLLTKDYALVKNNFEGLDLTRQMYDEAIEVDKNLGTRSTAVIGIFRKGSGRLVTLSPAKKETEILRQFEIGTRDPFEALKGVVKVFLRNTSGSMSEVLAFLETDTRLMIKGFWDGMATEDEVPIYRSSFLPGQFFTQRFVALTVGSGDERKPGLLLDNSPVFSRSMQIITVDNSKGNVRILSPLKYSYYVPPNCRVMNPFVIENTTRIGLLCNTDTKTEIVSVPAQ